MGRFNPKGTVALHWFDAVDTPVSLAAITQLELTTDGTSIIGVNNSEIIYSSSGWAGSPSVVDAPDWGNLKTGNVEGETTYGLGTYGWYLDDTEANNVIRALLTEGTEGYVVYSPAGTAVASPYVIRTVKVLDNVLDEPDGTAASWMASFSQGTPVSGIWAA